MYLFRLSNSYKNKLYSYSSDKMSDAATEFKPNLEKLRKLQAQASSVVIGGKVWII